MSKRVFLDTNVRSYASEVKVKQWVDSHPTHDARGKPTTILMHQYNGKSNPVDMRDSTSLPRIAKLAKSMGAEFCHSHEVNLELLFQPLLPDPRFHDVSLTLVPSAAEYRTGTCRYPDRTIGDAFDDAEGLVAAYEAAFSSPAAAHAFVCDFLLRLPEEDFFLHQDFRACVVELQKVHGGCVPRNAASVLYPYLSQLSGTRYQELLQDLQVRSLSDSKRVTTYLDAFLLWSAENAGCTHFLTSDKHIVERYRHEVVSAVSPSRFFDILAT